MSYFNFGNRGPFVMSLRTDAMIHEHFFFPWVEDAWLEEASRAGSESGNGKRQGATRRQAAQRGLPQVLNRGRGNINWAWAPRPRATRQISGAQRSRYVFAASHSLLRPNVGAETIWIVWLKSWFGFQARLTLRVKTKVIDGGKSCAARRYAEVSIIKQPPPHR